MNPSISVPTDNIYKFFALFGLVLVVSAYLGAIGFAVMRQNEVYDSYKDVIHSKEDKWKEFQANKIKAVSREMDTITHVAGWGIGIGVCVSAFGFYRWYRHVQPKHDRLVELQIQKLEKELEA